MVKKYFKLNSVQSIVITDNGQVMTAHLIDKGTKEKLFMAPQLADNELREIADKSSTGLLEAKRQQLCLNLDVDRNKKDKSA